MWKEKVEECFVVMYGRSNPVVSQEAQLSLAQPGWEWWKRATTTETELGRVLHKFTYTVIIQLYTNTISKPNTTVAAFSFVSVTTSTKYKEIATLLYNKETNNLNVINPNISRVYASFTCTMDMNLCNFGEAQQI